MAPVRLADAVDDAKRANPTPRIRNPCRTCKVCSGRKVHRRYRARAFRYFSGKNTWSIFLSPGLPRYDPATMSTSATVMPITI